MTSEWRTVSVGDLGRVVTGKTPKTAIVENYGGNIPFLTPSDDMGVKTSTATAKTLTERGLSEVKNCLLPPRSICVSCIGSDLGKVVMTSRATVTNQQINSIVPSPDFDADFIYYAMCILGKELNYISKTSTAVPIVNKSSFSSYQIDVPPLPEQQEIGRVLAALDARIANNTAINNHLEQIARAFFKSWFIDFEPFDGKIPVDWQKGTIADLGNVVGGSTPSKVRPEYFTKHGIAWITPKDLSISKNKFVYRGAIDITEQGLRNSSAQLMPRGTVLFSSRAPIGYIAIASGEVSTNQGFKSIVPKESIGTAFVYYFLIANLEVIENAASGSTFKEVSGRTMKGIPAIIPDSNTLKQFQERCACIFEEQELLEAENRHLATLRDTLLPRLMSGEFSVSEIGNTK